MPMRSVVLVALTFLTLTVGPAMRPAAAQGFKWWHDDAFKKELGLTPEQSGRLEAIFQQSLPQLRATKSALDHAQADFDKLVERASDDTVIAQVTQVEAARAEMNKARVMMLLKMRRSLTADQWAKFTALREQRTRRSAGTGSNNR